MRQKWRLLKSWKGSKTRNTRVVKLELMSGPKQNLVESLQRVVGVPTPLQLAAAWQPLSPSCRSIWKGAGIILD